MKIISTEKAPKAIGPFSQAIVCDNYVYCSGQISMNPETMQMVGNNIKEQTKQIFKNIKAVLNSCDLTLSNIIKTTVFLKNMDDFKEMNSIYETMFGKHKPARTTVEVARLPLNALIEIECIACVNQHER
jgi:2-iminobutanoate/2-iminopropanoate deaminase